MLIKSLMNSHGPRGNKDLFLLYFKGLIMGLADLIPGVSGGTIAFITGIYDELLTAISKINITFIKKLFSREYKEAIEASSAKFLIVLLSGIGTSIILFARLMHYLMENHAVPTWSLFFGLIIASITTLSKNVKKIIGINLFWIFTGGVFAYTVVSLVPVETPESYGFIFFCGFIAIMAMILPGLSGSFLLLILGKYQFITGAIKSPFLDNNLIIMSVFSIGAICGLLIFSRVLKYFLTKFHEATMAFLIGVLIGSLKKVWPWKKVLETRIVRGKVKVLTEANFLPETFDQTVMAAFALAIVGFMFVYFLEKIAGSKNEQKL
jgi:putative membrane protein